MSAHLTQLTDLPTSEQSRVLDQVHEIYFESSARKEFKDQKDKDSFAYKYLGYYLERHPEYCWIALDERVLGYIVASPQTSDPKLLALQPHLIEFQEYLSRFPAHLHINCHVSSRGQGIGGMLVRKLEEKLKAEKSPGMHIMTSKSSDNVRFYSKLGFSFETDRIFNGADLHFMGKSFTSP